MRLFVDKYNITHNLEKQFAVEWRLWYRNRWTGWSILKKYKTMQSALKAKEDFAYLTIDRKHELRIVHVYYNDKGVI